MAMKMLAPMIGTLDTRAATPGPKITNPFYLSPAWSRLMAEIKAERGARCEDPEHDPQKPRIGVRIFGDHVIEMKDGGASLDKANVLLRCGACHTRKTIAERAKRLTKR